MTTEHSPRPTLCIGILTLNEARRIQACIESARFADQIVVVDSGSTDQTRELAEQAGAEVHVYADWQGFAEQRNRLLQYVRCDYVFFLDADEVIPQALANEILQTVRSHSDAVWEILWNEVAYGRALTAMQSTGGIPRLFRRDVLSHYDGVVHEKAILTRGVPVHQFRTRLLHHSRETVYGSLVKLAQYAQLGAAKRAAKGKRGGIWRGLASALAIFFKLYILRRGILCGPQGFLFCFLIALECFFRYVILRYDRLDESAPLARR